jgi:flagellar protein FliS
MSSSNRQQDYLAHRVMAASPTELVRMLYEAALQRVEEALEALRSGDILRRGNSVSKAIEIIGELRLSLRREVAPAYCDTLTALYNYLQRQLIRAHAERSEKSFQEVQRLLQTLLEGWTEAMQNLAAGQHQGHSLESCEAVRPLNTSFPYEPTEAKTSKRTWQL